MESKEIQELIENCNSPTPDFSFKGHICYAIVPTKLRKGVYDGDTFRCKFIYNGKIISLKFRLAGIDTPELRTSNQEEKKQAYRARDFLSGLISANKYGLIKIEIINSDKYGRPLVNAYQIKIKDNKLLCENKSINEKMIDYGYAVPYFGGKKNNFAK